MEKSQIVQHLLASYATTSPADFDLISKKVFYFERLAQGDASLLHIFNPLLVYHLIPEVPAECPFIAQKCSSKQTVTQETHTPLLQSLQIICPPKLGVCRRGEK